MTAGSSFLYVLNQGTTASGGSNCTTADPCQNSNISAFVVGGNGILTPLATYYTQGINPFRMIANSTGAGQYLYVLDHDAPSSAACASALGASVTSCGDITSFQVNTTTGRLQLVENAQVNAASGQSLTYFPVPANPIDFLGLGGYLLTLSGTPSTGDAVFPYLTNVGGQLTVSQNGSQPVNTSHATALSSNIGYVYVLDNEAPTPNPTGASSQAIPFSVIAGGALQAQVGGAVPDDPTLSNPILMLAELKGKFVYQLNFGNNTTTVNAQSGITGYVIDPSTHQLSFTVPSTFGTGAGPQCLVEDPTGQYIYTANFNDSTVTGRRVDPNSGALTEFIGVPSSYALSGPATWCLMDGRTD
jgi:hypothetical protein